MEHTNNENVHHVKEKDWERLAEEFQNSQWSPPSSPPDISSGSSDIDLTISSLRPRPRRIVTRLDFHSCVVQSPRENWKIRARVTRNIINPEYLSKSEVSVVTMPDRTVGSVTNILEGINADVEVQSDKPCVNKDVLSTGLIKENLRKEETPKKGLYNSYEKPFFLIPKISPIIGKKNSSDSQQMNLSNRSYKRRKRKVIASTGQDIIHKTPSSPVICLHKSVTGKPCSSGTYSKSNIKDKEFKRFVDTNINNINPEERKSTSPQIGSHNISTHQYHTPNQKCSSGQNFILKPDFTSTDYEALDDSMSCIPCSLQEKDIPVASSPLIGTSKAKISRKGNLKLETNVNSILKETMVLEKTDEHTDGIVDGETSCIPTNLEIIYSRKTSTSPLITSCENSVNLLNLEKSDFLEKNEVRIIELNIHTEMIHDNSQQTLIETIDKTKDFNILSSSSSPVLGKNSGKKMKRGIKRNKKTVAKRQKLQNTSHEENLKEDNTIQLIKRTKDTTSQADFDTLDITLGSNVNAKEGNDPDILRVCKNLFQDPKGNQVNTLFLENECDIPSKIPQEKLAQMKSNFKHFDDFLHPALLNCVAQSSTHSIVESDSDPKIIDAFVENQCSSKNLIRSDSSDFLLDASQNCSVAESNLKANAEKQCDIEVNPTQLKIETESSQELGMGCQPRKFSQESQDGRLSVISSPMTSAENQELNMTISNCSTPGQITKCITVQKEISSEDEGVVKMYLDSAKKKRRLKKSGLAARMRKLLSRQESARRIWKHEANLFTCVNLVNKSVLLMVHSVWREYTHIMLHCTSSSSKFTSPLPSSGESSSDNNEDIALIVVMDVIPHTQPKSHSFIRIYPPWQTLILSKLNVIVVLGVHSVEEVQNMGKEQKLLSITKVTDVIYRCPCSCFQESTANKLCRYKLEEDGLEFLKHLLPQKSSKDDVPNKRLSNTDITLQKETSLQQSKGAGTISESITNQGYLLTGETFLQLCILKVFCYRSRNAVNGDQASQSTVLWSVLGCDISGECCEVILGSEPSKPNLCASWSKIKSREVLGLFYKFSGFRFTKRIQKTKNSGLWTLIDKAVNNITWKEEKSENKHQETYVAEEPKSILNNTPMCSKLETYKKIGEAQLFLYVLAPGTDSWEMQPREKYGHSHNIILHQAEISSFECAFKKDTINPDRCTFLAKVIFVSDDYLYATDTSVIRNFEKNYVRVAIKPSCFIPMELLRNSAVALLHDILLDKDFLIADKYSWIDPLSNVDDRKQITSYPKICSEDVDNVKSIEIAPPAFSLESALEDLVTLTGVVVSVDEETAFSWPVCKVCENDMLVELDSHNYLCPECSSTENSTRMSLEVYVLCEQIPDDFTVKVKLLQESIMKLLPASQENTEGYSLAAVLGQAVGPLICMVKITTGNSFFVNEIPAHQNQRN